MLLHLGQFSLVPSDQIRTALNELMLDPTSKEDLWLCEEQDKVKAKCVYYYTGPLKDVIYSLFVKHLTGNSSMTIQRNERSYIGIDFVESEKASRLASCLCEKKGKENSDVEKQSKAAYFQDADENSTSHNVSSTHDESDDEKPYADQSEVYNNHKLSFGDGKPFFVTQLNLKK